MDVSISFVRNSCSNPCASSVLSTAGRSRASSAPRLRRAHSTAIYATPMPTVRRYSAENSSNQTSFSPAPPPCRAPAPAHACTWQKPFCKSWLTMTRRARPRALLFRSGSSNISPPRAVRPRVRLVQEHHARIVDERAGDGQALRHTARERAHGRRGGGVSQLHRLQLEDAPSGSPPP